MSANVKFAVPSHGAAKKDGPAKVAPVIILPYDILNDLQGRRVTVLLANNTNEEIEGLLRTVDEDRGDLFLEDAVHYVWEPMTADGAADAEVTPGTRHCLLGGGVRRAIRECDAVMVNSRFVDLITPTLFGDGEPVEIKEAAKAK